MTGNQRTLPRTKLLQQLRRAAFRGEEERRARLVAELQKARLTGGYEGLRRLAAAARAGAIAGGNIEDSVLRVERTETAVPDGAADLVADLYRRMPEARIAGA